MKFGDGLVAYIYSLTSALDEGEWSASHSGQFIPDNHWIGGCVVLRAGIGNLKKRKIIKPAGNRNKVPRLSSP